MTEIQVMTPNKMVDRFPIDDGDFVSWTIGENGDLTVYRWHPNCYSEHQIQSYAKGGWLGVKEVRESHE